MDTTRPLDGTRNGTTLQPAAIYATLYPHLREEARKLGYALAVHGSLSRDLDLIAIPWAVETQSPETLVEAIRAYVGGWISHEIENPHGRRCYVIALAGSGGYIDLSVMMG